MPAPSKTKRLLSRLAGMSAREFRFRVRQQLWNRSEAFRQGFGFRANLHQQVFAAPDAAQREARFFFSPADLPVLIGALRARFPEACEQTIARAQRICAHRFDLLGYSDLNLGPCIDWHFDPVNQKQAPLKRSFKLSYLDPAVSGDSKITWELNRHQHFLALGMAYQLTHDEKFAREFAAQFYDWHEQNPYLLGINWASTLEVAFRSLSWLWARELFDGSQILSGSMRNDLLAALHRNACFIKHNLSIYFSRNTHLLGEALALFFTGLLCPQLEGSAEWQQLGWAIILREAEHQVHSDGAYFERSSYYHVYALDMFLHARILAARNHIPIAGAFDRTIKSMLEYLAALASAGLVPRFGDDDGGRLFLPHRNRAEHLTDPLSTGAAIYFRADWKAASRGLSKETLWLLGLSGAQLFEALPDLQPRALSRSFPSSGTYLMSSPGLLLAAHAGPFGAGNCGHSHADALSLTITAEGRELLADSGTFTYTGSAKWREAFRGTAAHNTVILDGENQAFAVSPFKWDHIPQAGVEHWWTGKSFDLLVASHTGYLRLASPVLHRRTVFFLKPHFWLVIDTLQGDGEHQLEINWHTLDSPAHLPSSPADLDLSRFDSLGLVPTSDSRWSVRWEPDWHSVCYGQMQQAACLRCSTRTSLPAEFATLLIPRLAAPCGRLERLGALSSAGGPRGFQYISGAQQHSWILSDSRDSWHLGAFSGDASFAYVGHDSEAGFSRVILCEGSYLSENGARIVGLRDRAGHFEREWKHRVKNQVGAAFSRSATLSSGSKGLVD